MASATVPAVPPSARCSTHARCSESALVAACPRLATAAAVTFRSSLSPSVYDGLMCWGDSATGRMAAAMRSASVLSMDAAVASASRKLP